MVARIDAPVTSRDRCSRPSVNRGGCDRRTHRPYLYGYCGDSRRVSRNDSRVGEAGMGRVSSSQVVPRNPQSLSMWEQRAGRARALADRYHVSQEILTFYAGIAEWQGRAAPRIRVFDDLRAVSSSLLELVARTGPPALADAARELDSDRLSELAREYWDSPGQFSVFDFFARALLQPYAAGLPAGLECPWC